ncbi:phenoloxidase-activating factor 2-like isoform X2 [Anopheles albimanus]|uniref:phenoloxidase-activating factor 2-like isoform X2 n=1 Tax=Anopheles albimanus TaxID=7167 RepID=UPI001641C28B|nr:phenoloxidase-activating factor 2-like isoform X2 [Anopheles albimanus]
MSRGCFKMLAAHLAVVFSVLISESVQVQTLQTYAERRSAKTPWMASIFVPSAGGNGTSRHCCNGAVISEQAVLTTASCLLHCGNATDRWRVRLGVWDLDIPVSAHQPEIYRVRHFQQHKDFQPYTRAMNIAVLELDGVIQSGPNIQHACLPEEVDSIGKRQRNLLYTGWGASFVAERPSCAENTLKTSQLRTITKRSCLERLRAVQADVVLPRGTACAATEEHDWLCRGKAGAPVVAELPGDAGCRYILYGLVSRNYGCLELGAPTVLTKVGYFRRWIDATLERLIARNRRIFLRKNKYLKHV